MILSESAAEGAKVPQDRPEWSPSGQRRGALAGPALGRPWGGPARRLGREGSALAEAAAGRSWKGVRVGGHPDEADRFPDSRSSFVTWPLDGGTYGRRNDL